MCIAIAISFAHFGLSPCLIKRRNLLFMSTCVHPRFSWGYLVLIISSFFAAMYFFSLSLSSPVSVSLDFLLMIALSIISDFYCHSHFICPLLSLSVSTLDCLFLIALSIFSNVYFHSHFIPLFCLRSCKLWIVYSWLPFLFSLTFIAIAISSPLFCLRSSQLWTVYS